MFDNDINDGYLSKQFNNMLEKHLNDNSFTFPLLYKGNSWEVGKAIEALEYLFEKAYESNTDESTRTRLSQISTMYLNPIIVELKDYKNKLDQYSKLCNNFIKNYSYISKEQAKPYYGEWYTEFKGFKGEKNED